METPDSSLASAAGKPSQHPLLWETVWLKQNVFEDAEAAYHQMAIGNVGVEMMKKNDKVDEKSVLPSQHPLLCETVWLKQNGFEHAEAAIHQMAAGTVSVEPMKKNDKPVQHPLLSETVWFNQNAFEDAEAAFHKMPAKIVSNSVPKVAVEKKKKNGKIVQKEEKQTVSVSKKADTMSWSQKLENKLSTIEESSRKLGNVLSHLQKGQDTTQKLMVQLVSAMDACRSQVNDQLNANQCCIKDVQKLLQSLNGTVGSIKRSMAAKDCKSYMTYEIFCQAMTDRLLFFEEEVTSMSDGARDVYEADWEPHVSSIISDIANLHTKMSLVKVKKCESKMAAVVKHVDSILKRKTLQKSQPSKSLDHNMGVVSSTSSASVDSPETSSSLSGECSDFDMNLDDIEEDDFFPRKVEKSPFASNAGQKAATGSIKDNAPRGKKAHAVKKNGGMTYHQLQGSQAARNSPVRDSKKSTKPALPGSGSDQENNSKSLKSKTYRSRNPKNSQSSDTGARASPNQSYAGNNNNASFQGPSMLLTSSSPNSSASFNCDSLFFNNATASANIGADYNPAFINQQNPLLLEQHLNELSQKIQQIHMASKPTFDLQQMLQETERLRQLAIERQQHQLLQEQFQQRYQMLLNAFSQYHKISTLQPSQASPPKAQVQAHSKAQPSARFKDVHSRDLPKPAPNTKGSNKPKKQDSDLSQTVSHLPGAVNVNALSKTDKTKAKEKERSDSSNAKEKRVSHPRASSEIIQVASFSPKVQNDALKGGISSMVVLDDLKCLLLVDIINSRLKLYHFTIKTSPREYDFKVVATLEMPNPYYMAKLSYNRVVVTRNGGMISIVQVTPKSLKVFNSIELGTQYYGVAFIMKNCIAAAAFELNRVDMLTFEGDGSVLKTTLTHSKGPELLTSIPSRKCVVYFEKQSDGQTYLTGINTKKQVIFKTTLMGNPGDVWNLSSVGDKVLCCNKQQNNLLLVSSSGQVVCNIEPPSLTVNLPFAIGFSHCGDLFLANDGAWECDANHYITTEINVFSFLNESK